MTRKLWRYQLPHPYILELQEGMLLTAIVLSLCSVLLELVLYFLGFKLAQSTIFA